MVEGADFRGKPTAVYLIVKEVFRRAADALEAIDPAGASTLRRASTHWLRHSAASHQADAGTDIRFIPKNLRHASIETTGLYLHAVTEEFHPFATVGSTTERGGRVAHASSGAKIAELQ